MTERHWLFPRGWSVTGQVRLFKVNRGRISGWPGMARTSTRLCRDYFRFSTFRLLDGIPRALHGTTELRDLARPSLVVRCLRCGFAA